MNDRIGGTWISFLKIISSIIVNIFSVKLILHDIFLVCFISLVWFVSYYTRIRYIPLDSGYEFLSSLKKGLYIVKLQIFLYFNNFMIYKFLLNHRNIFINKIINLLSLFIKITTIIHFIIYNKLTLLLFDNLNFTYFIF